MKTIHLFSLALLSLLCACSGEPDAVDGTPSAESLPVTVAQVSVAGASACVGEAPASRAAVSDNTYQLGVIRAAGGPYTALWNTPYKYASSGWTSATPIAVDHRVATFYAYYPYHKAIGNYAGLSSSYEFTLAAQAYSASEDICISAVAQSVTNNGTVKPTISFTNMPHVYSRIRLTLTRGAAQESTGAYCITNINFKNGTTNFAASATQHIQSKLVTSTPAPAGWDYNPDITLPAGATAPVIDLLVPPQSVGDGLSMMFTIDGHKRSVTIPQGSFTSGNLVAGEQYSIALTLRDVAITMVGTVQIEDWTEDMRPQEIPGYKPYVPYVSLPGIGLRVAKGNLMRAGGTGRWYLAPDQGFYTGVKDGGDYFCWGIDNPTSSGNSGGTSMDALTAGCVAVLGAGWRVPTKDENIALAGVADKCPGTYKSQRSSIEDSKGFYFGTGEQPDPANQDNYVFLPGAGFRNGAGSMYSLTYGGYWSSDNTNTDNAYHLLFNGSSIIGGANTYPHSDGQSVRCVADF